MKKAGIGIKKTESSMPVKQQYDTRRLDIMRKKNIMLKLTDILMQKQLITPDEKVRLITMIEQEDET